MDNRICFPVHFMNTHIRKLMTTKRLLHFLFFLVIILLTGYFWFQHIDSQNLNMDEIAWVLDTNHYYQRQEGNSDFFRVVPGEKSWVDPKFRIVDQPFLGKAIFGWYLQSNKLLNAWPEDKTNELYALFPKFLLPVHEPPLASKLLLSDTVVRAILVLRHFNSFIGFLLIVLFAGYMMIMRKQLLTGLVIIILGSLHPLIRNNFRLALPNTFEVGLSLLAIPILYQGFSLKYKGEKNKILFVFLGAIIVALAIDTKLSALSLLGIPLIVAFLEKNLSGVFIKRIVFFLAIWFVTLWIVDPVIRVQPLTGFWDLFYARFSQQIRFIQSGNSIPFIYTPLFLRQEVFHTNNMFTSAAFYFLFVTGVYDLVRKKLRMELTLCGYLLVINLFYLTAGFNRYALNALFVCIFLAGYGVWAIEAMFHRIVTLIFTHRISILRVK